MSWSPRSVVSPIRALTTNRSALVAAITLGFMLSTAAAQAVPPGHILAAFPAPCESPSDLAWDGQTLWVADWRDGVLYRVSPEDVEGLKRMAGLREQGASVLLVEAPLPATYMAFFAGGEQDYARFVEVIGSHAEAAGVPFWRAPPDLIPGDGWADYGHLNREGAEAFSEWLGARVGEAVRAGAIPNPTS